MTHALAVFQKGFSPLNLPTIEPLKVDELSLDHSGGRDGFNLKMDYKNVLIDGLTRTKVVRAALSFEPYFRIRSEFYYDKLDFTADYKASGQLLLFPIQGNGKGNISMQQMTSFNDIKGELVTNPEDGRIYANIIDYRIKLKPKRVYFNFENLFKGDKTIAETMGKFFNDNWELLFSSLSPEYSKLFGNEFKKLANKVFNNIPLNELILNSNKTKTLN